ncbi:hypothetical protein PF005_g3079 [Phytophthora fragariae]|uniref:Uncharacterized protein n=1 Tax=Phytophthora fragariae TaxID=53985 RepID=A0A6A3Z7A6_9STRA|nr:hypothetical protein PF006_g2502 [Phytophthora fragariae]KAE9231459.1 hypothetical protein PF005_g3079 [Phytophthora fragariae]
MSGVGDGEGSVEQRTVQEEVARLEAERLRRAGEIGGSASAAASAGDEIGTGTTAKVTSAAGRRSLRQEMMGDLWADEEEDEFKDAEEEREGDGAQAELEPEEKRTVPDADEQRDPDAEGLSGSTSAPVVYWSQGFGYDDQVPIKESPLRSFYGAQVKEEPREVPSRSPSGFIPLYTGTERRLPNPPMYGWSVSAQASYHGGWGATVKTEPTVKQDVKRESINMVIRTKTPAPGAVPANKKQPAPASHGEEDDEFPEDKKTTGASSGPADVATVETSSKLEKLTETMTTFVAQQQQWQQQVMRSRWQPPRSPRNRMPTVAATTSSPSSVNDSEGEDRDRDEVVSTVSTVCMNVSAELDGRVPTFDDVLHGENKNKIEKKKAEFIVVSTDDEGENLVVKVDDLKHEKVYEAWITSKTDADVRVVSEDSGATAAGVETSEVEKDESIGEETEMTEADAGCVQREEELGDEPSKDVAIGDVSLEEEVPADAPPPYVSKVKDEIMEEAPTPFADAPSPYGWGDEEYDLSDCLFSTWTGGEAMLAGTVTEDGSGPPGKASSVESWSYVESVPSSGDEEFTSEARVTVGSVRTENVERSPDGPGRAVALVEAVPILSEVRGVDLKVARAVARQAVFRLLQEARSNGDGQCVAREPPDGDEGTVEVPPLRDKVPDFDEEGLLWHADRVRELMSVNASSGERLRSWMRTYFDDNSRRIWLEL